MWPWRGTERGQADVRAAQHGDDTGAGPRRFPCLIPMGDDGRHEEVRPCTPVPAPCPCRAHHPLAEPARAPRGCYGLGALRAPPTRADHAVPPGAAACPELFRSDRGSYWRWPAPICQRRVRRVPRMRHPGAWLPAPALRRLRARQARGVQLQAPWVLPLVRGAGPEKSGIMLCPGP